MNLQEALETHVRATVDPDNVTIGAARRAAELIHERYKYDDDPLPLIALVDGCGYIVHLAGHQPATPTKVDLRFIGFDKVDRSNPKG